MKKRYEREFVLMASFVHSAGMGTNRNHLGSQQARLAPTAWLPQQRRNVRLHFPSSIMRDVGTDLSPLAWTNP